MRFDFFKENILTLRFQRNVLGVLVGALLANNLFLSGVAFYQRERIVLVPPCITKQLWIRGSQVSKEYLTEMGAYISKLFLDLSPSTASYNHGILLTYATPEAYGSLKKQFFKEDEEYTRLQLSTHFKPSEILANPETLEVTIKGTLSSYVAGKHIRDSQETIAIQFTHRDAGLLLERVSGGLSSSQESAVR